MNKFEAFKALCEGETIVDKYGTKLWVETKYYDGNSIDNTYLFGSTSKGTPLTEENLKGSPWDTLTRKDVEWEIVPKSGYEEIYDMIKDTHSGTPTIDSIYRICVREMEKE